MKKTPPRAVSASSVAGGEFLLYQAPDGKARIQLRVSDGTVWLTQRQLAELYQVSVPAIAQHVRNIFTERELKPEATIKDYLIVAPEGARKVIAKNYLNEQELDTLNRIVNAYIEIAELQAKSQRAMTMRDWIARLDDFLRMTEREVLTHAGKVAAEVAQAKAEAEFELYRRQQLAAPSSAEQDFDAAVAKQAKAIEKTRKPARLPTKKSGDKV